MKRLGLDYVWWLVAPQNPLKPVLGMAPLDKRVEFARRHATHPREAVMAIEKTLGTRYTIDTVKALKRRYPQVHFVWIMGTDVLEAFHRWKSWPLLAKQLPIAIIMRPGSTLAPLKSKMAQRFRRRLTASPHCFARRKPPALIVIDAPRKAISASAIRAANRRSEALVGTLPTC
jgi:nicotinate-nucleotide adenylyltransferase